MLSQICGSPRIKIRIPIVQDLWNASNFFEDTFLNFNDSAKWLFINVILIWIILASYQSNNLQEKHPDERELFIDPMMSKLTFGKNILERHFESKNYYSEPIDLYFGLQFGNSK